MDDNMVIWRTVWKDGPKGEERDIPVGTVVAPVGGPVRFVPHQNTRGRAYAFRNDKRYRKNRKKEA